MAKSKDVPPPVPVAPDPTPRLSSHPRARRQIRAAKAWSGLSVFVLVFYLALNAGLPTFDAGLRALAAGSAAYVIGWLVAVVVWRQLAVAQLEDVKRQLAAAPAEGQGAT
jgi:hypothetical protein